MILGIDLGTTYSVGAYIDESGNPVTITNSESETITPSVVYFEGEESVVVGKTAKENSVLDPKNVISLVKNYMGKTQNDGTPYLFTTDYGSYSPEAISSMILKKIASDATKYLGLSEPITNVIVTKPAYFQQAQIKATEDAIKLAGLNCVTLINEPTAAALYYASKTNLSKANILVYDLGGGTFDATVIHLENGKVQVLSTEGLRMVGGSFFDARLAEKICDKLKEKYGVDIYDDPAYAPVKQKLLIDIENAKIQLSSANSTSIVVFAPPISERIELTRKDIDEVVEKLYNKTENLVYRVIKAADLEVSEIDKIIMTGGSSKIPYIEEHLTKALGMPVSREVNPNEVVALGAALYGKNLEAGNGKNEVFTDVCSHGIGLKTMGLNGKVFHDVLIPQDSPLPAECEKSYEIGNQKVLTLAVREGDFKEIEYTTEIATVHVELPKGVPTGAEVRIKFALDERQLLHIFMKIPGIKLEQEISFERKNNMTDVEFGKWQKMVQAANDSIDEKNGLRRRKESKAETKEATKREAKKTENKKAENKIPKVIESVMEDTIGLSVVKEEMRDYMNRMDSIRKLSAKGQNEDEIEKCIAVLGKSGMGITHSAVKVAEILYKIGEVSQKTPITAKFVDIVQEDESKTTQAIQGLFQKAVDGVLIIDDFEKFYNDSDSFIGMQTIDLLQSAYESAQRKVTLVIAGDTELIKKIFMRKHSFGRLFYNFTIELTGYSPDEYVQLIHKYSKGKVVDDRADPELKRYLKGAMLTPEFDYIYFLDKMVNDAITNLSNKLKNVRHAKDEDYMILHLEDFDIAKGEKTLEELMDELNALTGITSVKEEVEKLRKEIEYDKKKEAQGEQSTEVISRHMVFTGNPGTGKTTVARILAGIFRELGVLPKGHLVEAKPADLIAEHVGETAIKTRAVIEKAKGGVLFIDEAYGLWQSDSDVFGVDAVNELLTGMENNYDNLIVIIAGYSDKIAQFMKCNPGLPSRFKKYIHFDDYSLDELMEVFQGLLDDKNFLIEDEALEMVRDIIQDRMREATFGNARGVRNLYQTIRSNQKGRLMDEDDEGIDSSRLIKAEDVGNAKKHRKDISVIMDDINQMVGLSAVKQKLGEFIAAAKINAEREEMGLERIQTGSMHMVFSGNPGTGKTTVAKKMGEILRALNMLSNGELKLVKTAEIMGQYEGEAQTKTKELVEGNIGKVIFIDEAYTLKNSEFGRRALDTLVDLIEEHRDNLCVILAGYTQEMADLLAVNPGLKSRFENNIIEFEDYSKEELFEIFKNMMSSPERKTYLYGEAVEAAIKNEISKNFGKSDFGNARGVRNLVERMILKQSSRVVSIPKEQRTLDTLVTILEQDVTGEACKPCKEKTYEELIEELNQLIGLKSVKEEVSDIADNVSMAKEYKRRGINMTEEMPCMNMVFLGNPGTGKTTVARMIGNIYKSLGVLPKGHIKEVSRSDLVARYSGQTAPLVNQVAQSAMGGVLFIDEAYSLYQGEHDQFGMEAIDALLKIAEDHRDEIVLILAGYENKMQKFYSVNPGLKSRFPNEIHFEDYTLDEKVQIFVEMTKGTYFYEQDVLTAVRDLIQRATLADPEKYANGRGVRVIKEEIVKNMKRRIRPIMTTLSDDELRTIEVEDVYLQSF